MSSLKMKIIMQAIERTGRSLRVSFNYRYTPAYTRFRELVIQGVVGKPLAVDFSWILDTRHGADYFRRWHREKHNSGGLLVHKATHHFDLVNWWIDSYPHDVFAMGYYSTVRKMLKLDVSIIPTNAIRASQKQLTIRLR